ncbi:MAG: hypothetical protein ACJAS4_000728 [Bacteriovoracaceae bacterium]|jgi:hypothetical protein
MCKEILGNQKGMSLIEVVVASAVSIIIAMGVMQINDNAQKGMTKIQGDFALGQLKHTLIRRLSDRDQCISALTHDGGVSVNIARDNSTALTHITAPQVTGPPLYRELMLATVGERIPTAIDFEVMDIVVSRFDNNGNGPDANGPGALVGSCNLVIKYINRKLFKNDTGNTSTRSFIFPLNCEVSAVDTTNPSGPASTVSNLVGCTASANINEDGHFKTQADGSINFNGTGIGTPATPRVGIGDVGWSGGVTAGITVGSDLGAYAGVGASKHGIALPNDTALTFGNADQAGLYYSGTYANTLESNAGFRTAQSIHTTGNIHASGKVSATTVNASNGNIGTLDVTNLDVSDLDVSRIDVDNIYVDNVNQHSDRRFKKEIQTIQNASDDISELRGVTYFMRRDEFPKYNFNNKLHHGLIAQEVERVFPNLVHTDQESGYKSVQYSNIVSILIEAFKEQKIEIEKNKKMFLVMKEGIRAQDAKQNSRLDALEQENKALRSELDELKEQVRKILKKKED